MVFALERLRSEVQRSRGGLPLFMGFLWVAS